MISIVINIIWTITFLLFIYIVQKGFRDIEKTSRRDLEIIDTRFSCTEKRFDQLIKDYGRRIEELNTEMFVIKEQSKYCNKDNIVSMDEKGQLVISPKEWK